LEINSNKFFYLKRDITYKPVNGCIIKNLNSCIIIQNEFIYLGINKNKGCIDVLQFSSKGNYKYGKNILKNGYLTFVDGETIKEINHNIISNNKNKIIVEFKCNDRLLEITLEKGRPQIKITSDKERKWKFKVNDNVFDFLFSGFRDIVDVDKHYLWLSFRRMLQGQNEQHTYKNVKWHGINLFKALGYPYSLSFYVDDCIPNFIFNWSDKNIMLEAKSKTLNLVFYPKSTPEPVWARFYNLPKFKNYDEAEAFQMCHLTTLSNMRISKKGLVGFLDYQWMHFNDPNPNNKWEDWYWLESAWYQVYWAYYSGNPILWNFIRLLLDRLSEIQDSEGRFPVLYIFSSDDCRDYMNFRTTLQYVWLAGEYYRLTKDKKFVEKHFQHIKKVIEFTLKFKNKDGLIETPEIGSVTWQDNVRRSHLVTILNIFYYKTLLVYKDFVKVMGYKKEIHKIDELISKCKYSFNKTFWLKDHYVDWIEKDERVRDYFAGDQYWAIIFGIVGKKTKKSTFQRTGRISTFTSW